MLGLLLLLTASGLTAHVTVTVGRELVLTRSEVATALYGRDPRHLERALKHLHNAKGGLRSFPTRVLSSVPVAHQNIETLEAIVSVGEPVLDKAMGLADEIESLSDMSLLRKGEVQLELLSALEQPLKEQARALTVAIQRLEGQRSGLLFPSVSSGVESFLRQARQLRASSERALQVLGMTRSLLGSEEPRNYLVLLINNAELRGAGGLPSGVGTLNAKGGHLELGRFYYTAELRGAPPYEEVPSPPDFNRRFGKYGADTTFWTNTTFSPDVPDVALVAARLFERATGVSTDGVIVADPRGLAALLAPEAPLKIPGTPSIIRAEGLPYYTYSTAYESFPKDPDERRDAFLGLGRELFSELLLDPETGGLDLRRAGAAVSSGHLRFVSLHGEEQAVLAAAGVSGDLAPPSGDSLLVTVQNLGGDKLDFWARRSIEQSCTISGVLATCSTGVTLSNAAPQGLPQVVSGLPYGDKNRPYALLKSFLEVYVPQRARITGVQVDGEPADFFREVQDGHTSIGVELEISRTEHKRLDVAYELDLREARYSLTVTPQPLAVDADIDVTLDVPPSWSLEGPGILNDEGRLHYSGTLSGGLGFGAYLEPARGLSKVWQGLIRFWNEPLF